MTELERARAHLQEVREQLRWARIDAFRNEGFFTKPAVVELHAYERRVENAILAALSWLWEAQRADRKAMWRGLLRELSVTLDAKGYRKAKREFRKEFPRDAA